MHTMRWIRWGVCCLALTMLSCGREVDKLLEEAQFALDAQNYAVAITKAEEALAKEATNFNATMVRSAGYAGRAGVNLLDLTKKMTESGIEDKVFNAVHDILVTAISSTGLPDLRIAVTTLSGFTGTVARQAEYSFQLGVLQAIEAFGRPSITAQPTASGTITPANITADDRVLVRDDLIAADNNLITGGIKTDNQLITTVRKSYCAMRDRSAGDGFTREELQDRVRCELDENRANLRAANGDFLSASVTLCSDFNFDACTSVDTTL